MEPTPITHVKNWASQALFDDLLVTESLQNSIPTAIVREMNQKQLYNIHVMLKRKQKQALLTPNNLQLNHLSFSGGGDLLP